MKTEQDLINEIAELKVQLHKSEQIRIKAIEHINNIGFPDWEDKLQDIVVSGKSLLKILKGESNE